VEVPGLEDPAQLKAILGKTAKMTFHLLDEGATQELLTNPNARAPIGSEILPMQDPISAESKVVIRRRVSISGDRLTGASSGFDQRGAPDAGKRYGHVHPYHRHP
jgi:preprotein translocase subunit SecD